MTEKSKMETKQIENSTAQQKDSIRKSNNSRKSHTICNIVHPRRQSLKRHVSILSFIQMQIELLEHSNRLGTAQNYRRTANSFSKFLAGADLPLKAITEELIGHYNIYLINRGVSRNSISFYMRNLRAIFNKAVKQHLIEQNHPFQNVYTGVARTKKRAIDKQLVSQLHKLDLSHNHALAFARDIFIFSYCMRGMAFVDIAYLRKSDIQSGMIQYARHKTGQQLYVRIEPNIQTIIDRYMQASENSPYIFPILTTTETMTAYQQYLTALNNYNRLLRKLSALLLTQCKLTSYTARHTWATTARSCNVPMSVISAGLGHTSERTTQIYLATLDNSVIDSANQRIIEMLDI